MELRNLKIFHLRNSLIRSKSDVYTSKFWTILKNCPRLYNSMSHSNVIRNQCVIFSMEYLFLGQDSNFIGADFSASTQLLQVFTKSSISQSIPG